MANPMILQLKMQKSAAEKDYKEYRLKLSRLMRELAALVNPYFNDIEEIQAAEIEQLGDELLKCKTRAGELESEIRKISKDLGE